MKYVIDSATLDELANAIRKVNGDTKKYTPDEMIQKVTTILEDGVYILVDENGTEVPAVYADAGAVFTATANDIRIGKTAITEAGFTTGEKEIPSYHTTEGFKYYPNGYDFTLSSPIYDYTKMQAVFCAFNTSLVDSVAADRVVINNNVYQVQSTESETEVTVDYENKRIDFGLKNETGKPCVLRYFMYKEIY